MYIGKGEQTVNDLSERKGNIGPPEIQLSVQGEGENYFPELIISNRNGKDLMGLDHFPLPTAEKGLYLFVSHSLYIIYSWRPSVTVNQMPSEPFQWQLITMTVKKYFPDVRL